MMILTVHRQEPQYTREFAHVFLVNVMMRGLAVKFYFNVVSEWTRFIAEYDEVFDLEWSSGSCGKDGSPSMSISIVEIPSNFWFTFDSRDFRQTEERVAIGKLKN